MSKLKSKNIFITMGDPLGIGPEVICKALICLKNSSQHQFFIIGIKQVFETFSSFHKLIAKKNIHFIEIQTSIKKITQKNSGLLSFLAIEEALKQIKKSKNKCALVTAPVSKERIHLQKIKFSGHTEYLCKKTHTKKFGMMLFHDKLKVILVTTHIPVKDVAKKLTSHNIIEKIELTSLSLLQDFDIKKPKIAICALNPHGGENGVIGTEEKTIIQPAINTFLKTSLAKRVQVIGPLPSDTLFHKSQKENYDAVICMYHDQALIPLKLLAFHSGVNFTLGLPFVRTSPDHGTAFDIAGKNKANHKSMLAAILAAKKMI